MMMSLGTVGHHVSVFHIDGVNSKKVPHIVNTCLAYIHGQFHSRDKFYIREQVCNIFSLDQIKAARKILYTTCDSSDKKYDYRGPNAKNNTERDRFYDAFEGIFKKMLTLDADKNIPVFSVPSSELNSLMKMMVKEPENITCKCEQKFQRLDEEINELRETFKSVATIMTSSDPPPQFPPVLVPRNKSNFIPPATRSRLMSTTSKRSASELSTEDTVDDQLTDEEVFTFPRKARKKARRFSNQQSSQASKENKLQPSGTGGNENSGASYSKVAQRKPKPPATKGTAKSTAALRGAVNDIFLFNCNVSCTTDDVIEHFNLFDIKIKKVEKKSHELSARSSFRVSPETKADFDKILSAECLPEEVCARKYIYRQGPINAERKEQFQKHGPTQASKELSILTANLLKELDDVTPGSSLHATENMDTSKEDENQQHQNGSE